MRLEISWVSMRLRRSSNFAKWCPFWLSNSSSKSCLNIYGNENKYLYEVRYVILCHLYTADIIHGHAWIVLSFIPLFPILLHVMNVHDDWVAAISATSTSTAAGTYLSWLIRQNWSAVLFIYSGFVHTCMHYPNPHIHMTRTKLYSFALSEYLSLQNSPDVIGLLASLAARTVMEAIFAPVSIALGPQLLHIELSLLSQRLETCC